jgi:hypothetical protein
MGVRPKFRRSGRQQANVNMVMPAATASQSSTSAADVIVQDLHEDESDFSIARSRRANNLHTTANNMKINTRSLNNRAESSMNRGNRQVNN